MRSITEISKDMDDLVALQKSGGIGIHKFLREQERLMLESLKHPELEDRKKKEIKKALMIVKLGIKAIPKGLDNVTSDNRSNE